MPCNRLFCNLPDSSQEVRKIGITNRQLMVKNIELLHCCCGCMLTQCCTRALLYCIELAVILSYSINSLKQLNSWLGSMHAECRVVTRLGIGMPPTATAVAACTALVMGDLGVPVCTVRRQCILSTCCTEVLVPGPTC